MPPERSRPDRRTRRGVSPGEDGRRRRRGSRRRVAAPHDVAHEVLSRGGRHGPKLLAQLEEASRAFADDRDRDALRLLRPLLDALPDAPSVRELAGLAHYRLGNYRAAARELEAYRDLSGATDQHPVLMDCFRAQRRWRKVDVLWAELRAASPSAALVTEGRIVAAGALADRGELAGAIHLLERKASEVKRPRLHQLRLWYALADLEERAGETARARNLFARVRRHDPAFADVAERLATLG